MPNRTWTYAQLFEGLDPAPGFVAELEKLGLLSVVAQDGRGEKIYGPGAREQLEKVLSLVELGYRPRDIAAIAKRVGLPQQPKRKLFRKPPVYLRLVELAKRCSVEPAVVEAWVERDYLTPALLTEGGEPLFNDDAMQSARALSDLEALGVDADGLRAWVTLGPGLEALGAAESKPTAGRRQASQDVLDALAQFSATLVLLESRMERWRAGFRRWDALLAGHHKTLDKLRRQHGLDASPKRSRRRLRRRAGKTTRR